MSPDLSQFSMHDLFRLEVEGQREVLTGGLLQLEREPDNAAQLEACMRSAHSLKGAARIVGLAAAVVVAHAMEDCFVAAQRGQLRLDQARIDLLRRKSLYAGHHHGFDEVIHTPRLLEEVRADWRAVRPLVDWLGSVTA